MHIIGVSSLAAGHLTLVPDLTAALEKEGRGDIMIVVGGVIPPADYPALFAAGAKAVFGPGTNIPRAAADLLDKLNAQLGYAPQGRGGVGGVAHNGRKAHIPDTQQAGAEVNTPFPVRQDGKFSVEEFFALIESRPEEERWQLIDGVAMMMPPPTLVHQRIASNLALELNTHFRSHRPELFAFQEVGLIVPEAELFRPEADVAVLDAMADYESYSNKFYCVGEILSDSNTDKDIAGRSGSATCSIPTTCTFLLIDQKRVRAEVFARAARFGSGARRSGTGSCGCWQTRLPTSKLPRASSASSRALELLAPPLKRLTAEAIAALQPLPAFHRPERLRTRSRSWRRSARRRCRSPCR